MRLLAWTAFALLLLAPATQGCSLLYQEFWQGDLDGDVIVTALGQDAVRIDLGSGLQSTVSENYFPRLQAADGYVFHSGQVDLGADCSGEPYFEVQDGLGIVVFERGGVDAFDVDGDLLAFVDGSTITVLRIGSWVEEARINYPRGVPESGPFGGSSELPIALALHAGAGEVAVTDIHGEIYVIALDETVRARYDLDVDRVPLLDWHQGDLVHAAGYGDSATFTIFHETGERTTLTFGTPDQYGTSQIVAGTSLLLRHGGRVVSLEGETTREIIAPADYALGAIAADGGSAVLLVAEDDGFGSGPAVGIQRVAGEQFGAWYGRGEGNNWMPATGPSFAWQDGPEATRTVLHVSPGEGWEGGREEVTTTPLPLLPVIGGLLLARRLR